MQREAAFIRMLPLFVNKINEKICLWGIDCCRRENYNTIEIDTEAVMYNSKRKGLANASTTCRRIHQALAFWPMYRGLPL